MELHVLPFVLGGASENIKTTAEQTFPYGYSQEREQTLPGTCSRK